MIARVEHVGSTSVPGLVAKPIIDLQAPVIDLADPEPLVAVLNPHRWHYIDPNLDRRPWRRFFVKVTEGRRSAHLHVMTPGSPRWREQLMFRDALRASPALVAEYAALKRGLATEHAHDRESYSTAKADFVRSVLNDRGQPDQSGGASTARGEVVDLRKMLDEKLIRGAGRNLEPES